MNKIIFTLTLLFSFLSIYSQSIKTFEHELLTLEYPASYKAEPIRNSPGMIFKVVSNSGGISISCKDVDWGENVSIWDDRVIEMFYKNDSGNRQIVSKTKETIQTKNGAIRCLKIMTNTQKQKQGIVYHIRYVNYLMLHKGMVIIVMIASEGKFTKKSSTAIYDKILKGLYLKGRKNE